MTALELLQNRVSCPALCEPGPTSEQLHEMYKAAMRAPDHASLRPWRFLEIKGAALERLGELFVKAAKHQDTDLPEEQEARLRKMPVRAPMILVAVASIQEHPKVPEFEQLITAGCAAHGVIQAAYAQGLGAMWRTGDMAYDPVVKAGLGLKAHEQVIGFIYLGSALRFREAKPLTEKDFVSEWR